MTPYRLKFRTKIDKLSMPGVAKEVCHYLLGDKWGRGVYPLLPHPLRPPLHPLLECGPITPHHIFKFCSITPTPTCVLSNYIPYLNFVPLCTPLEFVPGSPYEKTERTYTVNFWKKGLETKLEIQVWEDVMGQNSSGGVM